MDKAIKRLRVFFRISNAAFALAEAVGGKQAHLHILIGLHRAALIEIEKENPDMNIMDSLLAQMEHAAKQPMPNFEKGGITTPLT